MARWRLTSAHYLNVPGTEWEYRETDQNTGKQGRKVFQVPLLLNPDTPSDCNYPGEIIVAHEGSAQGRDYVFLGEPTPDMEPLDSEARHISDSLRPKWQHPIETLSSNGDYSASLIAKFENQMSRLMAGAKPTENVSAPGIDPAEFTKLQEQVQALMAENARLAKAAEPKALRRA